MAHDSAKEIICPGCGGSGRFETECCNGMSGCSCRGEIIDLGPCRVCDGQGTVIEGQYDRYANRREIQGLHYIGSGPSGMYEVWPNRGHMV